MLKATDLKFITQLRANARQTLTEISKKTHIPISTLYDKLKLHEGSIIKKHTTLLDFTKIGFDCRATLLLKAERTEREALTNYLKVHPAINNLYKINNGYDVLAEAIFENVRGLEEFLDELEKRFKIEDKRTHYIIDDLKREEFMNHE